MSSEQRRWFRERLAVYDLGLLSEPEEARFRELLNDPEFRDCYNEFARGERAERDDSDHLDAELIARWRSARTHLRGIERKMVREHLQHCASCQEELTVLGFSPELELDPALETIDQARNPSVPTGNADTTRRPRTVISNNRRDAFVRGWAVAMTVAAASLALVIQTQHTKNDDGETYSASQVPMIRIVGETRGATTRPVHYIPPGTRMIQISLRDLNIGVFSEQPSTIFLSIVIRAPDGEEIARVDTNAQKVLAPIVVWSNAGDFIAGIYSVEIYGRPEDGGSAYVREFELRTGEQ